MKILIATGNKHKREEIQQILNGLEVELISIDQLPESIEVEETGETFTENARLKAEAYFELTGLPVLADDSGLEVPALNNEPGVRSARYAGENADYLKNNQLLLERMKDLASSDRKARFRCVMCFKTSEGEWFFEGITEGEILQEFRGSGGFGYDPLFYVPALQKTYAELTPEEKNRISHRGLALKKFKKFLKEYLKKFDKRQ
ncbi:Nucleoside-triphosphatase rdgB [Caldithrix abyssi DSM 13497]|uniref:dITP/XTP pyrophosphatase n=1 Tax=Caldithrix abyssi DSM 13497 TaxID=880073 RepID=H1XYN4_CALAY|nr:XTP/dITP diphosphatase [Caldithrix abyssi]APF20590.1 XTP/dITP diphosphohydrolase [Caldithrix abyssi DSM 13497]EHO40903.1 Nucleoside-triphosphatase rdgB [Caldithrix abyssi DSM 13497]